MTNHTTGYAVVGTGYFGAGLARILNSLDGARVVAVLDPDNADAVAAELGCDVETDLDTLAARPDVDAVVVASPNHAHREPVEAAARHGKAIFCEKPIALSYEDCRSMVNAAAAAGVPLFAGHVMNFFGGIRLAKSLISDGAIGRVLYCHSARNGWEEPQPSVSWKKVRELSGGHLYHHIHEVDAIQSLMGPAASVTMIGGNVAHRGEGFGDEDDLLLLTLEFEGGGVAICEYGSAFRWPEHYLLIQGTLGAIRLDMLDTGVTVRTVDGDSRHLLHRTNEEDADRNAFYHGGEMDGAIMYGRPGKLPPLWLQGIMEEEMELFHAVVQGAPVPSEFEALLNGRAALAAIATADAATRSIREDRKVAVAEILGE